MSVKGKVAIITGAGNGIGRATALAFAADGCEAVILVDRNDQAGLDVAELLKDKGHEATFVKADVADPDDVAHFAKVAIERYGRIDCLFNNAAIEGDVAAVWDYDVQRFREVMAINVEGVFLGMRAVLPYMLKRKSGTIVNASSVGGLVAAPGMSAYVASKHAVLGLTKCAAAEAGPSGIRINAICPGTVDTEMIQRIDARRWKPDNDPMQAYYALMTPTRRNNKPDEIAELVLFLSSTRSGNINGTQIVADGGRGSALTPWQATDDSV